MPDFYSVLLGFNELCAVLLDFTGFYRVLPSWYRILLGFTVFLLFYWVLLDFTGFYQVLLGFTKLVLGFTGLEWVRPFFSDFPLTAFSVSMGSRRRSQLSAPTLDRA